MNDDLEKYIARRKRADKAFAKDFDAGYEEFKIGVMLRQAREQAGVTQEKLALITKSGYAGTLDQEVRVVARSQAHPQPP